jgi:hypothetical protein
MRQNSALPQWMFSDSVSHFSFGRTHIYYHPIRAESIHHLRKQGQNSPYRNRKDYQIRLPTSLCQGQYLIYQPFFEGNFSMLRILIYP